MKLKYLGTGAVEGIPALFCNCNVCTHARRSGGRDIRHRSSVLIDNDTLIDLSPDTFSQAISLGLDMTGLRQLILTHTHSDHFYVHELSHLTSPYSDRTEPLRVISSPMTLEKLRNEFSDHRYDILSKQLELVPVEAFETTTSYGYEITALPARHSSVQPYIYIIEKGGIALLYANDTGFFTENVWDFIYGRRFDVVSMDCAHLLQSGTTGHMCIEDNLTVRNRLFQQKNTDASTLFISTHFAHSGGIYHREIEERLGQYHITAAYDGYELNL